MWRISDPLLSWQTCRLVWPEKSSGVTIDMKSFPSLVSGLTPCPCNHSCAFPVITCENVEWGDCGSDVWCLITAERNGDCIYEKVKRRNPLLCRSSALHFSNSSVPPLVVPLSDVQRWKCSVPGRTGNCGHWNLRTSAQTGRGGCSCSWTVRSAGRHRRRHQTPQLTNSGHSKLKLRDLRKQN